MSLRSLKPVIFTNVEDACTELFNQFGKRLKLAAPLGLGKPNDLLNLIYQRAKADFSIHLEIYTALSLTLPRATNELARRFYQPFVRRHWGARYPELDYAVDAIADRLPLNVKVHEFYFQAGVALHSNELQRSHTSINYTHVAESVYEAGVEVVVQLIAKKIEGGVCRYSLSCNPDITLDLADIYRQNGKKLTVVGVVHSDLPFVGGDAEVEIGFFDAMVDVDKADYEIFSLPKLPISGVDHAIGFYASQLIVDDGTLQIGIGSLSDAVVNALLLRHSKNADYRELANFAWQEGERPLKIALHANTFNAGLYGLSELVTDGFMYLRQAHILKRHVIDEKSKTKTYLHGAFFLGSRDFYRWLRELKGEDFSGLRMGRVSKVNDLYDPNEILLRRQRKNPRFLNTCMQVTLLGGAASETLESGRVVSGVGGQYNFVSMSHELEHSRSILMCRSTRFEEGLRKSNIVWSHGNLTIPRHLRDIFVTEYGLADVRGKSDEDTIAAILNITDSEFQQELLQTAIANGKVCPAYKVPEWARQNTPAKIARLVAKAQSLNTFALFPFGSDFTLEEQKIMPALNELKKQTSGPVLRGVLRLVILFLSGLIVNPAPFRPELERMELEEPQNLRERFFRSLLLGALKKVHGA